MSESAELVKRLRAEAARNEAGVKVFDGVPDVDQANDTMQCAADDLRAAADAIEKLVAERDAAIRDQCVPTCHEIADKAIARATVAEARVKVLEAALRCILSCTPHARDGAIVYDCGNPFEIARDALTPKEPPAS